MPFAERLKTWRHRRGMSQLGLALSAGVSTRHVAFLETGRARPTRAMVVRLAEALAVPRHDRNELLETAGFASVYISRPLDSSETTAVREAVDWMLTRHDPFPALALDRHWTLVGLNRAARRLLASVGAGPGDSLLECFLRPDGLGSLLENREEVGMHLVTRLETESRRFGGDPVLEAAIRELRTSLVDRRYEAGALPAFMTTRLRLGQTRLSLFSFMAQLGSAEDIALAELQLELLFPADQATREALVAMELAAADDDGPPPSEPEIPPGKWAATSEPRGDGAAGHASRRKAPR
jgi:transcriptional regulator with XRE-family HTH domain